MIAFVFWPPRTVLSPATLRSATCGAQRLHALLTGSRAAAAGGRYRRCASRKKQGAMRALQAKQCDYVSDRWCHRFESCLRRQTKTIHVRGSFLFYISYIPRTCAAAFVQSCRRLAAPARVLLSVAGKPVRWTVFSIKRVASFFVFPSVTISAFKLAVTACKWMAKETMPCCAKKVGLLSRHISPFASFSRVPSAHHSPPFPGGVSISA